MLAQVSRVNGKRIESLSWKIRCLRSNNLRIQIEALGTFAGSQSVSYVQSHTKLSEMVIYIQVLNSSFKACSFLPSFNAVCKSPKDAIRCSSIMPLEVPQKEIRKRKSEDELRKDQEEPEEKELREIQRGLQGRRLKTRLERTDGEGYVEKPIRQRKRPWCCACQEQCTIEADDEGLKCHRCDHDRCARCLLGKVKNIWGQ